MQCPRCSSETVEKSNKDVKIDVCMEGCSGIWFDPFEFKKMDEMHESDEAFLAELAQGKLIKLDLEKKINCPRCDNQPMFRRFFSLKKSVEIDECPQCAGVWLDAGELTHIYSQFKNDDERNEQAYEIFEDMFGADLEKLASESVDELERNRRIARSLRFLCPSYYIPGKQDWGNF